MSSIREAIDLQKQLEANNKELVKALKLIQFGSPINMRNWLTKNKIPQLNKNYPLSECNRAMLCIRIAEQALAKVKEKT